jgi:predicted nucleic acid-binding protein
MRRVFIDTGAFVALRNRAELEHVRAREALRDLVESGARLFTSNYILAETYTALLVRVGREEAIAWGTAFRSGRVVEFIRIDEPIEDEAWSILVSHRDKTWSYVDATSFALMDREGVDEAFSFDRHFVQRGLRIYPTARV